MKREIIINSSASESRVALLEDGQLVELFVELPRHERTVGNIYKGTVKKVMPGMEAAFLELGLGHDAFLHFSDHSQISVEFDEDGGSSQGKRIHLQPGQEILVQIIKEQLGNKGPRTTTQVALPGRSLVLVPHQDHVGVSRRITDFREKRRLRSIANKIRPKGFGLIIRTVAEGKTLEELKSDMDSQLILWKRLERKIKNAPNPSLIFKDMSMASSVIRDLFTNDIDGLVVDSKRFHKQVRKYLGEVAPSLMDKVRLYKERKPIFDYFKIESEIEKSLSRKVWLNGGGYIIIDQTEALVTIDVNSGRFMGKKDHEENSFKVNLRAAREICRQLRLRDLGGLIVIDFIDMWEERNRKKVYDEVKKDLKTDRSKSDILPISQFGLMEMTRQRIKPSLLYTFNEPCPTCNGLGMVASRETVSTQIDRWVKRFRNHSREKRLELTVNPAMFDYLTDGMNSRIKQIMLKNRIFIKIKQNPDFKTDEFVCVSPKQNKDITARYKF